MNRASLLEAALGVGLGLLVIVGLALAAGPNPRAGTMRRGLAAGGLTYLILFAPILVESGITWVGALALAAAVVVPVLLALSTADAERIVHLERLVAVGLAAGVLAAGGTTLAMLGRLDQRACITVLAVAAAIVATVGRHTGSTRASGWALLAVVVAVIPMLAMGFFLGDAAGALEATVQVNAPPAGVWASLALAAVVFGASDPSLNQRVRSVGAGNGFLGILSLGVVVVALCGALLLVFDGSVIAPSLQFFTIPANLDIVPGPTALVLALLTTVFVAISAALVGAVAPTGTTVSTDATSTAKVSTAHATVAMAAPLLATAVAAGLALLMPGVERMVVTSALVAAAVVGLRLAPGLASVTGQVVGLLAGTVGVAVLAFTDEWAFGWPVVVALVSVALAANVLGGRMGTPVGVESPQGLTASSPSPH